MVRITRLFLVTTFFLLGATLNLAPANTLLGADKIYLRFTNTREDATAISIRLNVVPNHHRPFTWAGKTVYIGHAGAQDTAKEVTWMASGQRSPWIDIGLPAGGLTCPKAW